MDLGLQGKTAIVTGAGRGIGRRIAITLAEEGARVVVSDIDPSRTDGVAQEIREAGGTAVGIVADVTDRTTVDAMIERTLAEFGSIQILVDNAGVPLRPHGLPGQDLPTASNKYFVETDRAGWDRTVNLNIYGMLNCCQAVVPHMIKQNYGRIVNITSDAGIVGEPKFATYSMVKAGVIGLTRALAKELGRYRINVNCVAPGTTVNDQGDAPGMSVRATDTPEEAAERRLRLLRLYPMGWGYDRLGEPSDAADPVAFLCSDRAVWITGHTIRASGGYSIS